jgi:hypothetical protein
LHCRPLQADGDWTIVSGDVRITKLAHERAAWLASGLTAFFVAKGWDLPFWEKTARIVQWWPRIIQQTKRVQPGAGFYVPAKLRTIQFEQVPLERSPRRSPFPPRG